MNIKLKNRIFNLRWRLEQLKTDTEGIIFELEKLLEVLEDGNS